MKPAITQAAQLKVRLEAHAEEHSRPSQTRLHRAISWLARAERETADPDAQFMFLWVSFNAAYAREFGAEQSERDRFGEFLAMLLSLDQQEQLSQAVFQQFSGSIRTMIDNQFVFEPFWKAQREHDPSGRWKEKFASSKKTAMASLLGRKTAIVLSIVFDRLYVLRNQLLHGGATWNSSVNRAQVKDGARILMVIVPCMIELMLDHPERDFGDILYPVI